MPDANTSLPEADKAQRIAQIVADCLKRRAAGEKLNDAELLAGRDDLLPELERELRKLRLIASVEHQTVDLQVRPRPDSGEDGESQGREQSGVLRESADSRASGVGSHGLRIRCPYCHQPLEIVADSTLIDIPCVACGGLFNLAGDERITGASLGRIGHFELHERLGMGGFGTVWKAHDTKLGRAVAVKIPRKGKLNFGEVEEFLHEARIAAQLKHPHIVSVHEIGRDGETVYIVSDFVEGWNLSEWRKKQRLTLDESAHLVATIASALHYAHESGVIHRDLKPQNIMLDDDGLPHIMDFGLAKREAEDVTMTADGDILGTPAYMSPEQAKGNARLADRRADVYSIGVMLFELLTDELPFRGNAINLIRQTIQDEPPRPSKLNSTVPRDLETICLKCLEKEPARRYSTAQDVADELERYRSGEPVLARRLGTLGRAWRWARRHPLVPALVGTLALVLITAYLVALVSFRAACRRLDNELTARALVGNKFTATSVAETAGRDFARRFEAVERAASDPQLAAILAELQSDEAYWEVARQLGDPQVSTTRTEVQAGFVADPRRLKLQEWTQTQKSRQGLAVFAWFVTGRDGLQLARDPIAGGETIGRNYAWRSYFHGGEQDQLESWRPKNAQRLRDTMLSSAFVSQFTDQWVVVVSAPVEHEGKFLGVVGAMIELGKFAELPGNPMELGEHSERESRFAVLVDSRGVNPGQVLQHPAYSQSDVSKRRSLLDRSREPQYAVSLSGMQPHSDYRDPFAAEHPTYAQRWLVAAAPLKVRSKETGLVVLVQESYDDLIGSALRHLQQTLVLLSLVTLGLVVALVAPIWSLVLRMVK